MMSDYTGRMNPAIVTWLRAARDAAEQGTTERTASTDDQDSIAAAQTFENPDAFLQIYDRHYERIRNYLYRRTSNLELTHDLTSQTFIQALQWLRRNQASKLQVKPWLYKIATRQHLRHVRSDNRRVKWWAVFAAGQTDDCPPSKTILSEWEQNEISQALAALNEKYRAPIVLRYYENLSYREIGLALGIRESTARSRVHRTLQKMQVLLESNDAER